MKIIPILKDEFPLAQRFIKLYEETCITLASYIRRQDEHLYFIKENEKSSNILGILYIEHSIFHCIPYPEKLIPNELAKAIFSKILIQFIEKNEISVKCISGESKSTQLLRECLAQHLQEPYQTNHYNLMTATKIENPPENLFNGDEIKRCTENDLDDLLEIQTKYMNEEVKTYGRKITEAETKINLRQILKNQLCLALCSDGEIVAKANTNAIGIDWIQLGGIYTHPLYRRNGYAWQLVSALCRKIFRDEKKVALFVKDINVPAMELYKKVGFNKVGTYEICYFE